MFGNGSRPDFSFGCMAEDLMLLWPSAPLPAIVNFRLGAHTTNRWLIPKPPREQRVCRHCTRQAMANEQHLIFDCPGYSSRGLHFSFSGSNYQQDIRLFFEHMTDRWSPKWHIRHAVMEAQANLNCHKSKLLRFCTDLCYQARMSDVPHLAPPPPPPPPRRPQTPGVNLNELVYSGLDAYSVTQLRHSC